MRSGFRTVGMTKFPGHAVPQLRRRQRGLHRWVMAEVPSVVHWLPEYVGMGIDGVSIGGNDLTQLILGVDRDSERVCGIVRRV
ncbi:MAG: pyruvate, water dikinase [Mycobacterium sp.]|nr:pyruvate, water dikinase [Mycobacterium sp.]